MRAIGRWSVASFISIILGFSSFVVALLTAIAVVLTLFLGLILPFKSPRLAVTVPVSFTMETADPVRTGRAGFGFEILNEKQQARGDQKARLDRVAGSVRIQNPSRPVLLVNAMLLVFTLGFTAFVLRRLHAVFRSLTRGSPFIPDNARRIQNVGVAVLLGELGRAAIVFAENYYAKTHVALAGLQFDAWPRINLTTIGLGLVILVIAEVFRVGTRLDEEQSLTI
jgi:hypothetical protein